MGESYGKMWSQLAQWRSYPLFFPCFDTLIFTICPVRPITGALHFYASAVWANSAYSCCRQTALSPRASTHTCNQTGLCQKPRIHEMSQPLQEASSFKSAASNIHISSDILYFFDMSEAKQTGGIGKLPFRDTKFSCTSTIWCHFPCGFWNLNTDSGQHQHSWTDDRKGAWTLLFPAS